MTYHEVDHEPDKWNKYWLGMAKQASELSTCPRLSVGAVIVKERMLKGTGYNGAVKGADECDDVGCLMIDGSCHRTLHAENNAIIHTNIEDRINAKMYVTHNPCLRCSKMIVNAQISEVYYLNWYKGPEYPNVFETAGIDVYNFDGYDLDE